MPTLDERELATVLAALMYWKRNVVVNRTESDIRDTATNGGAFPALTDEEIERLWGRLAQ